MYLWIPFWPTGDKIQRNMNTKLKNILLCYASGMGIKSISSAFDISRNTVRRYVRMYQDSGIPAEKLPSLSDARLQELFAIPGAREHKPSERQIRLEALLPEYASRLSRKGMTVRKLYEEYHADHPDGYLHASFGMKLRQYMLQTNAIGHVEHRAGDRMYIDFAGDRLQIVDQTTAEVRKVEVFVAILPCSHYTYCEAVWSQKKEDLIKACENAIRFYGGAPCAIVPDNLKSAVTRSDRNEPVINPDFEAFAEHYGCAVVPARVRHPRDKALVENAVKLMYRSVYVDLEGIMFHDLESLNGAILKSLEKFNARNLTRRRESRRQLFDSVERDSLRPLPTDRYQIDEAESRSHSTAQQLRNAEQAPLQRAGTICGQTRGDGIRHRYGRHLPRFYPCGHASSQRHPVRIHHEAFPQSAGTQGEL